MRRWKRLCCCACDQRRRHCAWSANCCPSRCRFAADADPAAWSGSTGVWRVRAVWRCKQREAGRRLVMWHGWVNPLPLPPEICGCGRWRTAGQQRVAVLLAQLMVMVPAQKTILRCLQVGAHTTHATGRGSQSSWPGCSGYCRCTCGHLGVILLRCCSHCCGHTAMGFPLPIDDDTIGTCALRQTAERRSWWRVASGENAASNYPPSSLSLSLPLSLSRSPLLPC